MAVVQSWLRKELGDFSSIIFMKSIIVGVEEALGEQTAAIAMISAGRNQGKTSVQELNLTNKGDYLTLEQIKETINQVIGKEGTRLCIIDKIEHEENIYKVYTKETFCSSGEPQGSPRKCTYTLGMIQGFLEALLDKRLRGQQTESVLRGSTHDVMEYSIL